MQASEKKQPLLMKEILSNTFFVTPDSIKNPPALEEALLINHAPIPSQQPRDPSTQSIRESKPFTIKILTQENLRVNVAIMASIGIFCHALTLVISLACSYACTNSRVFVPWYWLYLNYIIGSFHATFIHMAGHYRWSGRWFKAHAIEHHIQLYPPKRFQGDKTVGARDSNSKYYLSVPLFPFFLTLAVFGVSLYSIPALVFTMAGVAFWLKIVERFHAHYHLINSQFNGIYCFELLREMHFGHHKGTMMFNFGIVDLLVDTGLGNLAFC
eukprot:TRINITY_DN3941_c0_g1_i1.p1 TRINITY_DN3941_c0_g1~~TRINITY_DN3941_c0_g1_i1.p1  ORF type:complete len:278 (+),score=46.24 TRINITY_DN3941_c0_g1_i1:25-834(+)